MPPAPRVIVLAAQREHRRRRTVRCDTAPAREPAAAAVMKQLLDAAQAEISMTLPNPDLVDPDAPVSRKAPTRPPRPQPPAEEPEEPAEPEPPPKTVDELLAELDELVGLTAVKAEIHRQAAVLRVEGLRKDAGLAAPTITRHMIFNGNPGTGKTTVARLVAGIYRALGLLSKGQLVEVDRSEMVAGYLGQTAMKTADLVKSAEGGVLFIDEAYSLSGDQYGTEAIDTLVKEMEDKRDDLVVIVAGYPVPMAVFISQNPGLESRFRTTIDFVDYTDDELVADLRGDGEGRGVRRRRAGPRPAARAARRRTARPDVRQRSLRPQRPGGGDRPARLAAPRGREAHGRGAAQAHRRRPRHRRGSRGRARPSPSRGSPPRWTTRLPRRQRDAGPAGAGSCRGRAHHRGHGRHPHARSQTRRGRARPAQPTAGRRGRRRAWCSASSPATLQLLGWQANGRAADNTEQLVRVQGIQSSLLRADALATNAFLVGGLEPAEQRAEYDAALDDVLRGITDAAEAQPADREALAALNTEVATYASAIAQARDNNRQGFPIGSEYLQEAGRDLRAEALPIIEELVSANSERAEDEMSGQHPIWLFWVGIVALAALWWLNRQIAQRFHRRLNVGLAAAAVAVAVLTLAAAVLAQNQSGDNDDLVDGELPGRGRRRRGADRWPTTPRPTRACCWSSAGRARSSRMPGSWRPARSRTCASGETLTAWDRYAALHGEIVELDASGDWNGAVEAATTRSDDGASAALDVVDRSAQADVDQAGQETTDTLRSGRHRSRWCWRSSTLLLGLVAAVLCAWGINQRRKEYA